MVGQGQGPNFQPAIEMPAVSQRRYHMGTEASDGTLLDRDQNFMVGRQVKQQGLVQRLGKSCIGHAYRQPPHRQILRRAQTVSQARSQRQQCHSSSLAQGPALAQGQNLAALRQGDTHPFPAGITQGAGAFVIGGRGGHHVNQFCLVGRRHHYHPRQRSQIGDVESASMGRPIRAHQTGAVYGEAHW